MRRALLVLAPLALVSPPAAGAAPSFSVQATPAVGPAPLQVTLSASGDAASYHWDLGDGAAADGAVVSHAYPAGAWTATVTATDATGETTQAQVRITSVGLRLTGPGAAAWGTRVRFRGRVVPALSGARVTLFAGDRAVGSALSGGGGAFSVRTRVVAPGPYRARLGTIASNDVAVLVRPQLEASLVGPAAVGTRLEFRARLRPARAGRLRVRIWRGERKVLDRITGNRARIELSTARAARYRLRVRVIPRPGYARATRDLRTIVHLPSLTLGAAGPSVLALEQRLAALHYALAGVNAYFGPDTRDAVLAFQKVNRMERTGRVDPAFWRMLQGAHVPWARARGDHVEVDKTRQVLFVVRDGRATLVTHVSTGASGNTPVGRWHVYSKVVGWSWVLWYPSYFLRGFAIHGYPDVPAYPASHGCVRVPMWLAPRLFTLIPYGSEIDIYP